MFLKCTWIFIEHFEVETSIAKMRKNFRGIDTKSEYAARCGNSASMLHCLCSDGCLFNLIYLDVWNLHKFSNLLPTPSSEKDVLFHAFKDRISGNEAAKFIPLVRDNRKTRWLQYLVFTVLTNKCLENNFEMPISASFLMDCSNKSDCFQEQINLKWCKYFCCWILQSKYSAKLLFVNL